jgi:hypothetical protein
MIHSLFLRQSLLNLLAGCVACFALTAAPAALAAPKTVCTVTINSSDEKDAFQRNLPAGDYRFVELVQRGQPDWLESARRRGVRCDALIISGHFDDGSEFYTDRHDDREFLTVHELQRASCSAPTGGLFEQLKEVYLFGCNTLQSEVRHTASSEITRGLLRGGHQPAEAERLSALLSERYGQSNRDRLRHVFKDVPVLYGFSSKAPLGRTAGPLLERYFQTAPGGEIASGRVSPTMLKLFEPSSMIAVAGLTDSDPHLPFRNDMCGFADDRQSDAQKIGFLHDVLLRDMSGVRMFLDHIESYTATLGAAQRNPAAVRTALAAIEADGAARDRFLAFARDADDMQVQTRMMALARSLGWLSAVQEQTEWVRMLAERMKRDSLGKNEVDLVCASPAPRESDLARQLLATNATRAGNVAHSAVLACLGDTEAHVRTVRALTSARHDDALIAQTYLRLRPLANSVELRDVVAGIARMPAAPAQVRALESLARQRLTDVPTLQVVAGLFPQTRSIDVQRAIASVLIRADMQGLPRTALTRSLRQHRLNSPGGNDVIDLLIRMLEANP